LKEAMMTANWRQQVGLVALTLVLTAAGPVSAHHSFAMYDNDKVVTVEGTVKEFQWANPHVIVRVEGAEPSGAASEQLWTLELPAPGQISRNGWTHSTLSPGDKVKVELHPFRDGRLGGSFISITLPNGQKINR
jgi:hypothetical protein